MPAPAPAIVRVDPTQIEQAILNLVLNARDALPGGGVIRVEVAHVPRTSVAASPDRPLASADEYVRLRVVDNGVGMTAEARAHLFEPFFTTKEVGKGTGLGLASVYGIVRQSNGVITGDSSRAPAARSRCTFRLRPPPQARQERRPASPTPVNAKRSCWSKTKTRCGSIVSTVLRRQGYQVLEAPTPTIASAIFAQHDGEIDLLLTDVVMPGMSGPVLAQRLIAHRPELRVLFISGYADVAVQPEIGGPNVNFLSKPFQASALTARVAQILGSSARAEVRR